MLQSFKRGHNLLIISGGSLVGVKSGNGIFGSYVNRNIRTTITPGNNRDSTILTAK